MASYFLSKELFDLFQEIEVRRAENPSCASSLSTFTLTKLAGLLQITRKAGSLHWGHRHYGRVVPVGTTGLAVGASHQNRLHLA
jgi:hypothetical protein